MKAACKYSLYFHQYCARTHARTNSTYCDPQRIFAHKYFRCNINGRKL